ncbi:hypothetical protein SFC43_09275 [Bacteroides sp. CR5/BHMF/2]|nr:hypothetical protein [Bacteroides sp. CR5/BHMF/2]
MPNGQVIETSGNRQGYQYPGMRWQNTRFGSLTRGSAFNYYLSPSLSSTYMNQWGIMILKSWQVIKWNCKKIPVNICIKMEC